MFRKVFQNRPKKKCAICGADSVGVNFNVETCLACKAFFRRNALSAKALSCPFSDNCQITKETKRFCPKCRLRKCFDLGMKKEWILSDSERMKIKEKVAANKTAKKQQMIEAVKQLQSSGTNQILAHEKSNSPLSCQTTDEPPKLSSTFELALQNEDTLDLFESIDLTEFVEESLPEFDDLLTELGLEFSEPPLSPQNQSLPLELTFFTSELLEPEIAHLRELLNAGSGLKNPYRRLLTDADTEYSRWCRMPQHTLHRLIRFAKGLKSFNQVPVEAQSRTLRRRLTEMLAIRSTTALFDRDRQSWMLLDDVSQASVLVSMAFIRPFCTEEGYRRHQALPTSFRDEWREDNLILDLLTAVVLFHPHSGGDCGGDGKDQTHLQNEFTRYTTLLSRYLHLKYPSTDEATECHHQMMVNIAEMQALNGDIITFFRSYWPALQKFPFFVELLQLKLNNEGDDDENSLAKVSPVFSRTAEDVKVGANDSDAFARFPITEVLRNVCL